MAPNAQRLTKFIQRYDYPCWCGDAGAGLFCAQMFRRNFAVLRCAACGTHRILPRALATDAAALQLYNNPTTRPPERALDVALIAECSARVVRRIAEVGIRFEPGMTVVDVGCSVGALVAKIRRLHGCAVFGVDADTAAVARAREVCPEGTFLAGLFQEHLGALPAADVVIASAIIEHVVNPVDFVRDLGRQLKPGGRLFLLTPNAASRNYAVARTWWRDLLAIGEHIYLFTPESLAQVAARSGFRVLASATDYDPVNVSADFRSLRGVALTHWSLARNAVLAACRLFPRDHRGDLLYASFELVPAPRAQP